MQPHFCELRRNAPQANIVLVVKPRVYNLAEACPYVNRVLVFDWRGENGIPLLSLWLRQWRAFRFASRRLRRSHFAVALIPRWDADTYDATSLAVFSGAEAVVAYSEACTDRKRLVNRGFDRLVTHVILPSGVIRHEVEAGLAMLEQCGGTSDSDKLEIWLAADDRAFARANLREGLAYVAVAVGAATPDRRWPAERFAQLAAWLQTRHGLTPILIGSSSDAAWPGVASFLGRTTLRQAAALIGRCVLFVGNDSGPKHIAAAMKTPVVEINPLRAGSNPSQPNSTGRFGAWQVPHRVVQPRSGSGECAIEEVPLAAVQSAIDELLKELGHRSGPILP